MKPITNIQVIIINNRAVNPFLLRWLDRFKHVRLTSASTPGTFDSLDLINCKRNRELKRYRDHTKLPWVLLLDDDIIPLDGLMDCPDTWPLIECKADVASARFVSKAGSEAHGENGEFAFAAAKISRRALERTGPPWSQFDFDEEGITRTRCECNHFAAKARDAGFYPAKAGAVGHIVAAAVIPAPKQSKDAMCRIKLLSQLRYKGAKKPPVKSKGKK